MQLINKIIISKFRSFGENEKFICNNLNIFSGSNDSGKSNVIKALNLFFNEKTDSFTNYSPDNDFNKWFRDNNERGQRNIRIKVFFNSGTYKDPSGINNGFIAEKIYGIDGGIVSKYYYNNNKEIAINSVSYRKATSVVKGKIKYMYVPAIRDIDFRKYIQRELLQIANAGSGNLLNIFDQLKTELNGTFKEFSTYLNRIVNINILSEVNFSTLLESMSFNTNEQIRIKKRGRYSKIEDQSIPMMNRGDGIQMQFLSFLLWFIANKDQKHKYIWGFEEPEIAYEFRKQFEMADIFVNVFAKDVQIFLTTHSPAFIFNVKNDNINQYRVYKNKDKTKNRTLSRISDINEYIDDLFTVENGQLKHLQQDIWGTNYQRLTNILGNVLKETDDFKEIQKKLIEITQEAQSSKQIIENQKKEIEQHKIQLQNLYPDKIFICEDRNSIQVWEHLFQESNLTDIMIMTSSGCTNDSIESVIKFKQKEKAGYNPKIFRQIDLDGYLPEQVTFLEQRIKESHSQLTNYMVKFLPVNELENFVVLINSECTDVDIKSNTDVFDNLKDALVDTAKNNLSKIRKRYIKDQDSQDIQHLFNNREAKMRNYAKLNPSRLLPGKEICKQYHYNVNTQLKNLKIKNFPEELNSYLNIIKSFFDS